MRKLKENRKKGFTLVELIVVLVILAILAALLVPALTGYIDKAKEKQLIAETRQTVMAAQTIADELYAKGKTKDEIKSGISTANNPSVIDLADVPGTLTSVEVDEKGHVTDLVYTRNSDTCTYDKDGAEKYTPGTTNAGGN